MGCNSLPGVLLGCIYVSLGCAGLSYIRSVIYLFIYLPYLIGWVGFGFG